MKWLDLTLPSPAENLALDESLLDLAEEGAGGEVLRFWEAREPFVVVGYGNRVAEEVNLEACAAKNIPVLRRCSGGGAVLQGPGCLNYALILRSDAGGPAGSIPQTNDYVMGRHRDALSRLTGVPFSIQGHTDLVVSRLKVSGNAQRRKRRFLIFHGTFLIGMNFALIEECLLMPSRQPDYRAGRSHREFLTNLCLTREEIKAELRKVWSAAEWMEGRVDCGRLVAERYGRKEWAFRV